MQYTFVYLQNAAAHGAQIGSWKGYKVYAGSALDIKTFVSDSCYILYDDDNKLYKNGIILGVVLSDGRVIEGAGYYYKRKNQEYYPLKENNNGETHMEPQKSKESLPEFDFEFDDEDYSMEDVLDNISKEVESLMDISWDFETE